MDNYNTEIKCVKKGEPGYPEKMKSLPNMPKQLYYLGNLPDESLPALAVVGARSCSPYGRIQAFRYAREASANGVQVISGLATGIDSEGHKGALEGGTPTFAVMGGGPDICYPASNRSLYERILRTGGGILSEYAPGVRPMSYSFPARNRIISALSDVVLVVEARKKSGSLITAEYALDQGKTIYALPGAVTDSLSLGCNKLIFDGAGIAYCPEVVLDEWGLNAGPEEIEHKMNKNNNFALATDLKLLYSILDCRPTSFDSLVRKSGMDAKKVSSSLVELILMGFAQEVGKHYYIRL